MRKETKTKFFKKIRNMKNLFYFLIIILFTGCNKNDLGSSKLVFNITYKTTENSKLTRQNSHILKTALSEEQYSQFGDFITSITPTVFIGKFLEMRLQHFVEGDVMWKEQIKIIDSNMDWASSERLADFSNNATVRITPVFEGVNSQDMTNVEFNLFTNSVMFFYQEFEIPAEYNNNLNLKYLSFEGDLDLKKSFIGGERNGHLLKIGNQALMAPIFDSTWTGFNGSYPEMPHNYVFGSTDSTYVFYNKNSHNQSINDPVGQGGYIIRSNAYKPLSLGDMSNGKTKIVTGVIAFNTTNLIQIYAGKDNIPYTSYDIFVYAPRFWERLSVNLTSE
jgi:hypothetical protein